PTVISSLEVSSVSRMAYQAASTCLVPNGVGSPFDINRRKRERYSLVSAQSPLPIDSGLNSSKKKKYEHNHQDEAQAAGGIVSPATVIGPRGKRADEQQNEYDEQYGAEWLWSSPLKPVRL